MLGHEHINADEQRKMQEAQIFVTEEKLQTELLYKAEAFEPQEKQKKLNKAKRDNELIGFSLEHADTLKLDVSKKARLKAIKGRNLALSVINDTESTVQSPDFKTVIDAVTDVEIFANKPLKEFDSGRIYYDRHRQLAGGIVDVREKYNHAIVACNRYLQKKSDVSPSGAERAQNVRELMSHMLEEMDSLTMAMQLMYRGHLGDDENVTVRQLMINSAKYREEHPTLSKEEIKEFESKSFIEKTMFRYNGDIKEVNLESNQELLFFFRAINQISTPDILVKQFGESEKDKKKAANTIKNIYKMLGSFKKDTIESKSFLIGDIVVTLFQAEDGSLELSYETRAIRDGKLETDCSSMKLKSNTKMLMASMAANMVENEELFGKELTENIMSKLEYKPDSDDTADNYANVDIASAYLRKNLGIKNLALTNVGDLDKINLAKKLASGKESKETALNFLRDYEYGGSKKRQDMKNERAAKLEKMRQRLQEINSTVKAEYGDANTEETAKRADVKTELPQEALEYEYELRSRVRSSYDKMNNDLDKSDIRYSNDTNEMLVKRTEKANHYNSEINRLTEEYNKHLAGFYKEAEDYQLGVQNRKEFLESAWDDEIQDVEAKFNNDFNDFLSDEEEERLKAIKEKDIAEINARYQEEGKKLEEEWHQWVAEKEKEINTYSSQIQEIWDKEALDIDKIDKEIKTLQDNWNKELDNIVAEYNATTDPINREIALLTDWKEYYNTRNLINEKKILSFTDWKVRMETEKVEWEKEKERDKKRLEKQDELIEEYLDLKFSYERLKKTDVESTTGININGRDTLELVMHRNKLEKAGILKDKVEFVKDEEEEKNKEEKKTEEKNEGAREEIKWTKDEEELRDVLADFIFSQKTWEMDMESAPGTRLFNIIKSHKGLLRNLALLNDEKYNKFIDDFVDKLPVEILGGDKKAVTEILGSALGVIRTPIWDGIKEQKAELAKRDEERKKRRDAKRREIATKATAGMKLKQRLKYYDKLKSGKKKSLFEIAKDALLGKKETKEQLEERLKLEKYLDEIEKAGEDEFSSQDLVLRNTPETAMAIVGFEKAMKEIEGDGEKDIIEKLASTEEKVNKAMEKAMRGVQESMKAFVDENFKAETGKKEELEKLPYYRDERDIEKRKVLENKGQNQLMKMVQNSISGEKGFGQYIRNVFSDYIAGSSILDIRSMLSSAIRNAKPTAKVENPTEEDKMKALASYVGGLFKGAGPLLQKILQGLPSEMIPKGMEEALEDVKCNLAPIPDEIVEAQMLSLVERSGGRIKKINIIKSLGAASIGQAFLCTVIDSDEKERDVVIKLLRPDARNKMLREAKILRKCASDAGPGMLKTFEGQLKHYLEELDLTIEAGNCEKGIIYKDSSEGVKSMKVNRLAAPTPNAMMVDQAMGDTVVKIVKDAKNFRNAKVGKFLEYDEKGNVKLKIPKGTDTFNDRVALSKQIVKLQKQQKRLIKLSDTWVRQAIFGEGFYHGDLHAGNIMMSEYDLTVIDYGNCTKLTKHEQEKILIMMMAATAGDDSAFLGAFKELLSDSSKGLLKEKEKELKAVFKEVMRLGSHQSVALRIGAALTRAQELGFEMPASIYGFQQCQMRLQTTIDEFNAEIKEYKGILEQLQDEDKSNSIQLKQKYMDAKDTEEIFNTHNFKMSLLPDDDSDGLITELIRCKNDEERNKLKIFLGELFMGVRSIVDSDSDKDNDRLLQSIYINPKGEYMQFTGIKGFITREEYKKQMDDGVTQFFSCYDEKWKRSEQNDQNTDKRIQNIKALKEKMKEFDVIGALDKLHKAEDSNAPKEDIEALEKDVVKKIIHAKKTYMKNMPEEIKRVHEAKFNIKYKDADEALKQTLHKEVDEKIAEDTKGLNKENHWDSFAQKLGNAESLPAVEEEMKHYYSDPKFGDKIKNAFEDYKKSFEEKAAPDVLEKKKKKLMGYLSVPVLLTFGEKLGGRVVEKYDKKDEVDFFEVTGTVVGEEWRKALKNLGYMNTFTFGRKILGDTQRRNIGVLEFLNIMRKEL